MAAEDTIHAADRLDRIFEVISAEARARPDFAARLLYAFAGSDDDFISAFDAGAAEAAPGLSFSFVAVLHTRGEVELRALLNRAPNTSALLKLADEQHIPYDPAMTEAAFPHVIDALVEGARFRLNDRLAAAS
ncbi:MAG: hypothetical protein H7X92_14270 [Chitinophagales bacterium]|nr:hypothetical protein [Hyphomicrobiales bacterium]